MLACDIVFTFNVNGTDNFSLAQLVALAPQGDLTELDMNVLASVVSQSCGSQRETIQDVGHHQHPHPWKHSTSVVSSILALPWTA
jgi:hypothetical protein